MRKKTFKKGIHPYDGKELTMEIPIRCIDAEDIMVYPLSQSIGEPSKAVVAVGDRVLKGQMIAQANGIISAPIFSAVSGTVSAIEKRVTVDGIADDCIVIENDRQEEAVEDFGKDRDIDGLSKDDIVNIVKGAGIVGLGGAGFPTGVKISPKNAEEIDTLIINCAECEPYLTADYRLMIERCDEILKGVKAVLKALPNAKAVIGIESNKPQAIDLFNEKIAGEEKISVCPLKTKYPQGGERQIIYAITGRKINSKMLPADKKCIVVNAATCYAIYEAVYKNMPLIHKVVTVTGEGTNSPCNLDIPLGISHAYLVENAGGIKEEATKIISGGPMMGVAMTRFDAPVVKTSAGVLAFVNDDVAAMKESACIHCGKCVSVCPQFVVPQMLAKSVRAQSFDKFESLGGMECIECGCCTFVCPAKIPLTQMFRLGKSKVREIWEKN